MPSFPVKCIVVPIDFSESSAAAVAARMTHEFFIGSIIGIDVTSDFTE
jgi:hypothetical protein